MKHTSVPNPPRSRDAIESWLDVLVSMLNLPSAQRDQVRDELEDHLRSRVDDLLIMGKPEPEAIQMAIHELGETAELAKLISSASRTRTTFRRFAMNATFFILAGSILTASVSMMMPSTAPLPSETSIVEQLEQANTEAAAPEVRVVYIDKSVFSQALEQIAATFERELVVSNNAKKTMMSRYPAAAGLLEGEFTLEQAIARLRQMYANDLLDLHIGVNDQSIELMTQGEYERSRVVIRAYPIPVWAESSSEQGLYASSIEQLISTKHDLDYTTIQPINGSLVVAAPPEVHAEIVNMSDQLQALAVKMREKNEQRRSAQRDAKQRQIERLRHEYEQAKTVYIETQRKLGMLQGERTQLDSQRLREIQKIERPTLEEHDKVNAKYLPKMGVLDQRISEFRFEVEDAKARFERLQQILIDAEANLILSDINDPIPVDSMQDQPANSSLIHIAGPNGVRSGTYQLPEVGRLMLARFLAAANAQGVDGKVTLNRDGDARLVGSVKEICSGQIEEITLLPEDQVVISATD